MKKNKLLSAVLSAVMSVSAVTGLTANAFGISDNGLPEYITSGKEVEDFDWLFDLNELYDYDNYDAVYCQEPDNKHNIWTFYTVSSRADYIFFAFPISIHAMAIFCYSQTIATLCQSFAYLTSH